MDQPLPRLLDRESLAASSTIPTRTYICTCQTHPICGYCGSNSSRCRELVQPRWQQDESEDGKKRRLLARPGGSPAIGAGWASTDIFTKCPSGSWEIVR